MTEQTMTPDEVLACMRNVYSPESRTYVAVAALIARNAELEAAMDICRKLAALRDGLDNSNSSAEEMASRLAHKAQALLANKEASHG